MSEDVSAADLAQYRAIAAALREENTQLVSLVAPLAGIDGAVESKAAALSRDNYKAMHTAVVEAVEAHSRVLLAEAQQIESWCDRTEAIQNKAKKGVETITPPKLLTA